MAKSLDQIPFDFSEISDNKQVQDEPTVSTSGRQQLLAAAQGEGKKPVIRTTGIIKDQTQVPQKPVSARGRRSLKDFALEADLISVPEDAVLFQKQYYSIGEVAGWFRVNQSLLRYWESEFDILQPRKNRKGDRFFRPVDVKNLQLIYDLLRRRKFTIEGAKDYLKKTKKSEEKFTMIQSLEKIKSFLNELKASL
ncbi:MAG: MerR family transcriptional regulator [Bacteroidetes bacterium]|nr:MerR family transcriptional regulator [Bacteroidota bacterium]MBS1608063.1 MerR family transcriptional regulator [Bacteroidota bacterium]